MDKFRFFFYILVVTVIIGCTSKKDADQQSDSQLEAMLAGVWISDEDESVAFMAKKDTLYYPDEDVLPVHFRIYKDTLFLDGTYELKYVIKKLTPNIFIFRNQNGEEVKLVKTNDRSFFEVFHTSERPIYEVNQKFLKRDTIVTSGETRYHCYMQINPTTYKVVKNSINDEGVGVGKVYYDNIVNVNVYVGSRRLFSHDFKKQEFISFVPKEIMRQSILSDISYKSCSPNGVVFQAQLRIPESASSYIVNINISPEGKMLMSQP